MITHASNAAGTGSPATPSTNRTPRTWFFSMLDSNKEVAGTGVIVAPSASAARVSAERLLAGTNSVVVHEKALVNLLGGGGNRDGQDVGLLRFVTQALEGRPHALLQVRKGAGTHQ